MAYLFHTHSGIAISSVDEKIKITTIEFEETDEVISREERTFTFWLNSIGVQTKNLSEDMKDGLVLLQVKKTTHFIELLRNLIY